MRALFFLLTLTIVFPCTVCAGSTPVIEHAFKKTFLTGYTRSIRDTTIASEVTGKIVRINYDIGDRIEDTPFCMIDTTFIDFSIAGLNKSLEKLEVSIQQADSRVRYLEKEFKRIDTLYESDSATESRRDASSEELVQARLQARSLRAEKAAVLNSLAEMEERKQRHSIRAPKGWVVVQKMVEEGEIISPQTPLARVADYRILVVPLSVTGDELEAIEHLGKQFDAYIDNEPVKAAIRWINPEFDEGTRKLAIEVIINGYEDDKRGGLEFSLPISLKTTGLAIPKDAVINRYENPRITLKETGDVFTVLIVSESEDFFMIAEDNRLKAGMELLPAHD